MTKKELIKKIADELWYTQKDVKAVIDAYNATLVEVAKKEGKVKTDLWVFKVVDRKAREWKTPQGKEYKIPARKVLVFKVKKSIKFVK